MGGTIFAGFREPDGTEHLIETWTNWMPWRTASVDFLRMGKSYRDLIERADHPRPNTVTRRVKSVAFVEYGIVLFDFKDRAIFSCNGYYHPGEYGYMPNAIAYDTPGEAAKDARDVLDLEQAGCLYSVRRLGFDDFHKTEDDPVEHARLLACCEKLTAKTPTLKTVFSNASLTLTSLDGLEEHCAWTLRYRPLDMTVTHVHDYENSRKTKGIVQKFLDAHGWKAKIARRFRQ